MTTGVGRFVILSLGLHLAVLFAWYNQPSTRLYQAGQPLQISLLPTPAVSVPPVSDSPAASASMRVTGMPHELAPDTAAPVIDRQTDTQAAQPKTNSSDHAITEALSQPARPQPDMTSAIATVAASDSNQTLAPTPVSQHPDGDDDSHRSLLMQLQTQMNTYFSYPPLARRRNWQGEVHLGVRVEANGRLSNIHVVHSSGYSILDKAAINSLRRIATLPDAGHWLGGRHFDTVLPVEYRLIDS